MPVPLSGVDAGRATHRNQNIDALRGCAILMVVWFHLFYLPFFDPSLAKFRATFFCGVELFFVISGFIVSSALIPKLDEALETGGSYLGVIKSFYLRRAFRLFPSCWLWILLTLTIFKGIIGSATSWSNLFLQVLSIVAYFNNFLTGTSLDAFQKYKDLSWHWSLSIEEQFYILYPLFLCLALTRKRRIAGAIAGICLITFVIRPWAVYHGAKYHPTLNRLSYFKFDYILMGVAAYLISTTSWFERSAFKRWLSTGRRVPLSLLFTGAVPVAAVGFLFPAIGAPVFGLVATLAVLAAAVEGEAPSSRPASVLAGIGQRAYLLYLDHIPLLYLSKWIADKSGCRSPIFFLALAFAIIVLCTEACYRFIEQPMIRRARVFAETKPSPTL